jgi:adenylate cyclase
VKSDSTARFRLLGKERLKQLAELSARLRRKRRWRLMRFFGVRRSVGLAMLAALIALRIVDPAPLEDLRLRSFDFYQILKPRIPTIKPVVIVDIDEDSLRSLGQWPWPRTLVADLIERLNRLGAVAIAFDILFPEQDRLSPNLAVQTFRNVDEDTKTKLRNLPSNDDVLADVLKKSRVVLGQSGILQTTPPAESAPQTGIATRGPDPSALLVTFPGLLRNVPVLEQAAAGRGVLSIRNERDGIVRRVPLVVRAGGIIAPALTLDMLRVVTNSGAILISADAAGIQSVAIPGLVIPTDAAGQLWIHFGPHDPIRYVSAKDVIEGRLAPDKVAGKLILIGTSAVGLLDIKTTPLDPAIPGVEIHAQILETVLSRAVLSHPNWATVAELGIAVVAGLTLSLLAPALGAGTLLVLFGATALIATGLSWYLFTTSGILLDISFPLLASFLIYVTLEFIGYMREQKDRRRIRSAFGQYLSPALVEQLAQSPEKLVLGGEARTMTVMFSDVRGFTTISETYKHDPQGLTQLMNRFLTPMTNAIIERKGTIDKYMGDAIMAFWNAPIDDTDHEINACRAALDMLRRVDDLNLERELEARAAGQPFIPIRIGVGINTGPCVVGNMGSDLRFDYSVLGDPVNLASRLEGRSKAYGTPIIVGAATAEKAAQEFAALEVDLITVKGKTEPERIYTILGGGDIARSADFRKISELNATMLACYRKRDWGGALEALQLCRHMSNNFGLDEIYNLYLARVQSFQEKGPPDDWDGVFAVETK